MLKLSGMNETQSARVNEWLKSEGLVVIDVSSTATLGRIDLMSQVARNMCNRAGLAYTKPRQLFFVPIDGRTSNAYAFWPEGFDVVGITAILLREIEAFCVAAASVALNIIESERMLESSFSGLEGIERTRGEVREAIAGILMQGVLAFFVGHEVGHLIGGHQQLIALHTPPKEDSTTSAAAKDQELPRVNFVDEAIAFAGSRTKISAPSSRILNSLEIDADVYALKFLTEHWTNSSKNLAAIKNRETLPKDQQVFGDVFRRLTSTKRQTTFLSMSVATIALTLLGFEPSKTEETFQSTHPLTPTRLLVSLRVLSMISGEDPTSLLRREATEALTFIHVVMAQLILESEKHGDKHPIAEMLKTLSVEDRLDLLFKKTGMKQAIQASEDLTVYLKTLAAAFIGTESGRRHLRRTSEDGLVDWASSAFIQ